MIDLTQLLIAVCVVVGCFYIGRKVFQFDDATEDRRKAAGVIASLLDRLGLPRLAEIFRNYSVGDYSGFIASMVELGKLVLKGEAVVMAELDTLFDRLLEHKLADPKFVTYLQTRIDAVTEEVA
jgi:hypothetical protein